MKNHIIPRYYLRGFTNSNGKIFTFRNDLAQPFETGIPATAVKKNFYSDPREKMLNETIELPAKPIIEKIKNRQEISPEDKKVLALYVLNMMVRVPYAKERISRYIPEVFGQFFTEENLHRIAGNQPPSPKVAAFFYSLREQWETVDREERIEEWWDSHLPTSTLFTKAWPVLTSMTWQFLTHDEGPAFVTSDNPVFYHSHIGLAHQNVELTFPISQNIALWATWNKDFLATFAPVSWAIVREINRRTVAKRTNSIFAPIDESWVRDLLQESPYTAKRILSSLGLDHVILLAPP